MQTSSVAPIAPILPIEPNALPGGSPAPGAAAFINIPPPQTSKIVSDKNVDITLTTTSYRGGGGGENLTFLKIDTGDGADDIHISTGERGQLNAVINGKSYLLPAANSAATSITIKTNKGDDTVRIDPDVMVHAEIHGGEGNDHIQTGGGKSHVYGGAGNDTIKLGSASSYAEGNDGDDTMMGGTGNHSMYGGNGKDRMYSGYGPDSKTSYMDGGNDDDLMYGGSGHNIMHGGKGNDQINAYGRSHIYTGRGQDSVYSTSSDDVVYGKRSDHLGLPFGFKFIETVPLPENTGSKAIDIEGSPEFKQRVEDDLEFYRGSPNSQHMLKELDAVAERTGAKVTIKKGPIDSHIVTQKLPEGVPLAEWRDPTFIREGTRGAGATDLSVTYNPVTPREASDESRVFLPPTTTLYHELGHAYNATTGSMLAGDTEIIHPDGTHTREPNNERQVVGLETAKPPFDFDNDPTTAPTTSNPYPLTENALRDEMGLPLRKSYDAL